MPQGQRTLTQCAVGYGRSGRWWLRRRAGAQPAAAPEPTGHEDDCEARPGCHDRLWQSLFEEAMGGDAESGKVLRAVHKKVVDQQLRSECSRLIGVAQPLAGAWLQAIPGPTQPVQAALDAVWTTTPR
jgi:hypothetical protein